MLGGWLVLAGNANILTAHWARVLRVQTAPEHRGTGVGHTLMAEVARAGRDEYRLAALHLELRGGMGLERFYEQCGWREIGRWPLALRLGEGDYRDEVLMRLPLGPRPSGAPRRPHPTEPRTSMHATSETDRCAGSRPPSTTRASL